MACLSRSWVGIFRFWHFAMARRSLRPVQTVVAKRGLKTRVFLDVGSEAESAADIEAYA